MINLLEVGVEMITIKIAIVTILWLCDHLIPLGLIMIAAHCIFIVAKAYKILLTSCFANSKAKAHNTDHNVQNVDFELLWDNIRKKRESHAAGVTQEGQNKHDPC